MGHTLCETCIQTSTKLLNLQIKTLLYQRSFGSGGATRWSSVAWIHQVARIHQVAQTEWGLDFKEEKQTEGDDLVIYTPPFKRSTMQSPDSTCLSSPVPPRAPLRGGDKRHSPSPRVPQSMFLLHFLTNPNWTYRLLRATAHATV